MTVLMNTVRVTLYFWFSRTSTGRCAVAAVFSLFFLLFFLLFICVLSIPFYGLLDLSHTLNIYCTSHFSFPLLYVFYAVLIPLTIRRLRLTGLDEPGKACGPNSDCINRLTQVECLPEDCRCKSYCKNQRYASLPPIPLPSTLSS